MSRFDFVYVSVALCACITLILWSYRLMMMDWWRHT